MIHEISLLNRLLADLTIQSISSKSYANPHIVGKANPTPKTPIKKNNLFLGGFIYNRGGGAVFINRGKGLEVALYTYVYIYTYMYVCTCNMESCMALFWTEHVFDMYFSPLLMAGGPHLDSRMYAARICSTRY